MVWKIRKKTKKKQKNKNKNKNKNKKQKTKNDAMYSDDAICCDVLILYSKKFLCRCHFNHIHIFI